MSTKLASAFVSLTLAVMIVCAVTDIYAMFYFGVRHHEMVSGLAK